MSELILFLIPFIIIQTIVGAFINGSTGAAWGFFLGPIGWIIAAILKDKTGQSSGQPLKDSASPNTGAMKSLSVHTVSLDHDKWSILKEVDEDIASAAKRVAEIDARLEGILAERFLVLNDKAYLKAIVENLIANKDEHLEKARKAVSTNVSSDGSVSHRGYRAFFLDGKYLVCGKYFASAEEAIAEIDSIIESGKDFKLDLHKI